MAVELSRERNGGLRGQVAVLERGPGQRVLMCPAPLRDTHGAVGGALEEPEERLVTVEELAGRLQYSVDWVRQQVRLGRIPAIRFNERAWRFHWPTVLKTLHGLR